MSANEFTRVQVFTATMLRDRESLGDQITRFLAAHRELQVVDKCVTQSSDRDFHCLTITLFLRERLPASANETEARPQQRTSK